MIKVEIVRDDVADAEADVLLLKHAQSFYGADESVFLRLVQAGRCTANEVSPKVGAHVFLNSENTVAARRVLFVGTPTLRNLRYREIRLFAQRAIAAISQHAGDTLSIATTIHGAGFGLDIVESFRSMVLGFQQGLTAHPLKHLKRIVFVERNARRFEMLEASVADVELILPTISEPTTKQSPIEQAVAVPASKKIVFVAMPFSDDFEDVFQFGIYQTVRRCGYVCEKVDESAYAGSIVDRIFEGIQSAEFVIADLTEARPNVYLEVGFAWGLNKPVLLIAKEGERLHFDLSHHKCLFYRNITKLSDTLERTIQDLFLKSETNRQ